MISDFSPFLFFVGSVRNSAVPFTSRSMHTERTETEGQSKPTATTRGNRKNDEPPLDQTSTSLSSSSLLPTTVTLEPPITANGGNLGASPSFNPCISSCAAILTLLPSSLLSRTVT
jgi:hypothetical protein